MICFIIDLSHPNYRKITNRLFSELFDIPLKNSFNEMLSSLELLWKDEIIYDEYNEDGYPTLKKIRHSVIGYQQEITDEFAIVVGFRCINKSFIDSTIKDPRYQHLKNKLINKQ